MAIIKRTTTTKKVTVKKTSTFKTGGKFYNSSLILKRRFLRKVILISYASSAVKIITNLILIASILYFGIFMTGHGISDMAYKTIKIGKKAFLFPLIFFTILLVINLASSFMNMNARRENRIKFYSNLFSDIEKSRIKMFYQLIVDAAIFIFVVIMFSIWFVEINKIDFHEVFFSDSFKHSENAIKFFAKYLIIIMIIVFVLETVILGLYIALFIVSKNTINKYKNISKFAIEEVIEKEVMHE